MSGVMLCGCKTLKRGAEIQFCDLHRRAFAMRQALNVLRGYYAENMPESPFLKIIDDALKGG
jgi:hypothetical protein